MMHTNLPETNVVIVKPFDVKKMSQVYSLETLNSIEFDKKIKSDT